MKMRLSKLLICGLAVISFSAQALGTPAKPSELTSEMIGRMPASDKNTALGTAAFEGRLDDVRRLLTAGADMNSETDGMKPTHRAAMGGRMEVFAALTAMGADTTASLGGVQMVVVAAYGGNVELMRMLLRSGASLNVSNERGLLPVHGAAASGNTDMLRFLLENGANPNAPTKDGALPLAMAAGTGHLDMVLALLAAGANVNAAESFGDRALHAAARSNHPAIVKALVAAGADVNAANQSALKATHLASAKESAEVLKILLAAGAKVEPRANLTDEVRFGTANGVATLLAAGANVNAIGHGGKQAIHHAAFDGVNADIVNVLLAHGAQVNTLDADGRNALHYAAMKSSASVVKAMVAAGAAINSADRSGKPAIYWAVINDNADALKGLIDSGANINAIDDDGATALMRASFSDAPDCARLLLAKGANVLAVAKDGSQAIHFAARQKSPERILALLAAGARLDVVDNNGWTPLHFAVEKGRDDVINALLAAGASARIANKAGEMPYMSAAKLRYTTPAILNTLRTAALAAPGVSAAEKSQALCAIDTYSASAVSDLKAIISTGANVDMACNGMTPLHRAISQGSNDIVKLLLAAGARLDTPDTEGRTPIHVASEQPSDRAETLKALLAAGASLNAGDMEGNTPLHKAANWGHKENVGTLLKAGARKNKLNKRGENPFDLAVQNDRKDILALLMQSDDPQEAEANRIRLARIDKRSEILAATYTTFDAELLGYKCNAGLAEFPDDYFDLKNPLSAKYKWEKAFAIARNFDTCVKAFGDSAARRSVASFIPVYDLLSFDEKTKVNARYMDGVEEIKGRIRYGRSEINAEMARVKNSQELMEGAAEAERRAAVETRAWIQDITQTLTAIGQAMRPPEPPQQQIFFAADTEEESLKDAKAGNGDAGSAPAKPSGALGAAAAKAAGAGKTTGAGSTASASGAPSVASGGKTGAGASGSPSAGSAGAGKESGSKSSQNYVGNVVLTREDGTPSEAVRKAQAEALAVSTRENARVAAEANRQAAILKAKQDEAVKTKAAEHALFCARLPPGDNCGCPPPPGTKYTTCAR